jgi:hypothetical protein
MAPVLQLASSMLVAIPTTKDVRIGVCPPGTAKTGRPTDI